jgi:predicted oxidoreductase
LHGVLLQAWSPLAQGVFAGTLDGQPESIRKAGTLVREYAERRQTSIEAILLAWLLKHPAKIQPVLGTTRPDRLRSCAQALTVSLSREEWYSLFAAARGAPMP